MRGEKGSGIFVEREREREERLKEALGSPKGRLSLFGYGKG